MSTASEDTLQDLHKQVALGFKKMLQDDPSPAGLAAAARFLKDNAVIMIPESQSALEEVAKVYEDMELGNMNEDSRMLSFPSIAK